MKHSRPIAGILSLCFLCSSLLASGPDLRLSELKRDGLDYYRIEAPTATWLLERSGAGLAAMIDRDGNDWLGFNPTPGSRAGGEFRGFPNAVHQQAGSYFHARNSGTDPSTTKVEQSGPDRVTISAVSSNGLWACRYDFVATHCAFTMTRMPPDKKYWALYEGTPGGTFEDGDWWMTSSISAPQPMAVKQEGDIPAPAWMVFGDRKVNRVAFLYHHEDGTHPDRFYAMDGRMTVFGFGREGVKKFLDTVPQSVSIGFLETTSHAEISRKLGTLFALAQKDTKPQPLAERKFTRTVIDAKPPQNPWIKIAADLDRDGRPDVIIGGSKGPLVWYANPDWRKSVIADGGYDSVDGEATDIDGDGDLDLVIGGVLWYENPLPKSKADSGPWKAHRIATHRTHDVEVADLDGDSRVDVVVRGQTGFGHKEGHRILIFRQTVPDVWASCELSCPEGEGLKLTDMNGDGRTDIVIGGRWFENPGKDILSAEWKDHVFTTQWNYGDTKVATGDLNGDGRPDVVLTPAEPKGGKHKAVWYAAPANPRHGNWTEHVIESEIETVVHAVSVADLDGDGQADIAMARMHQGVNPQDVSVYFNQNNGQSWRRHALSTKGSHNILLIDLDGDGRIDVLGANHGGGHQPVEWWR